jgi:hypothetical protein
MDATAKSLVKVLAAGAPEIVGDLLRKGAGSFTASECQWLADSRGEPLSDTMAYLRVIAGG